MNHRVYISLLHSGLPVFYSYQGHVIQLIISQHACVEMQVVLSTHGYGGPTIPLLYTIILKRLEHLQILVPLGGSWKQSPVDSKGKLYTIYLVFKNTC